MKRSVFREYAESLIIAVILALFVRTWVFQAFKIPTGSMENNLLIGDHLIVNKLVFAPGAGAAERAVLPARDVRRGDIIVFKYPVDPERDFIKRVIGLPGERLEWKDRKIYINDQVIDEPYVFFKDRPGEDPRFYNYGPVTVPAGQYFMMGDNRNNSEDSRWWGFVPHAYLKGKALFIYFSLKENGSLLKLFSDIQWGRLLNRVR
jgi:signal peptidase I